MEGVVQKRGMLMRDEFIMKGEVRMEDGRAVGHPHIRIIVG